MRGPNTLGDWRKGVDIESGWASDAESMMSMRESELNREKGLESAGLSILKVAEERVHSWQPST